MTSPAVIHSDDGKWPVQMRVGTAAAYCDEVSVAAFMAGVRAGLYPKGTEVPGKGLRWLKADLKAVIRKIHGREADGPVDAIDLV